MRTIRVLEFQYSDFVNQRVLIFCYANFLSNSAPISSRGSNAEFYTAYTKNRLNHSRRIINGFRHCEPASQTPRNTAVGLRNNNRIA